MTKCSERRQNTVAIGASLCRAEALGGPAEDAEKIPLGRVAELDLPATCRHDQSFLVARQYLLRDSKEMVVEIINRLEGAKAAFVEIGNAELCRILKCLELRRLARLLGLNEPQTLSEHFAGVLIPARADQGIDDFFMMSC